MAALAGVSHITVSRVVREHPTVRGSTRERVHLAMQALGYEPNPAARALVTGRSSLIGVITSNTGLYGPAAALIGLESAAAERGYFLTVAGLESPDAKAVSRAVSRLRQQAVAGVVLVSPQAAIAEAFESLPDDVPMVAIWGYPGTRIPVVASDEALAARSLTKHLLELGHRSVWHVAGPTGRIGAGERIRGWQETLVEQGLTPPPLLHGDWTARSGYKAAKRLMRDRHVTAIFAGNDQMALGVVRAAAEAGRSVPKNLSVVGFDDIPEAAYFTPSLTTVRQHFRTMGRRSMELLLLQMGSALQAPVSTLLPAELIIRESSGPSPGSKLAARGPVP